MSGNNNKTAIYIALFGGAPYFQSILSRRHPYRRWWERPHLGINNRQMYSQSILMEEMRLNDRESFINLMRLTPESFDKLLQFVGPSITHYSPREPINVKDRLSVTLRYLATGESISSLSYVYRLGISTTKSIIDETLCAIYNNLREKVIPNPSMEDLRRCATGFAETWNMPNCVGAIDGKHIRIKCPSKTGSEYFNYKKYFSIVLLAICDSKYRFIAVDVGAKGRQNDGGVYHSSSIGQKLKNNNFNMPEPQQVPFGPVLPHFLVGDAAFALKSYMMSPFTGQLDYQKQIFNYRLSRARRVIENAFGILVAIWRILKTEIDATPAIVDKIVLAAICLHNFRMDENRFLSEGDKYVVPQFIDQEVNGLCNVHHLDSLETTNFNSSTCYASEIRNELMQYFLTGIHLFILTILTHNVLMNIF